MKPLSFGVGGGRSVLARGGREAFITSLGGLALGGATAVLLIWLGHSVFPGIAEAGTDAGMRLKVILERLGSGPPAHGGLASALPGSAAGYVFVDVDAEPEPEGTTPDEAGSIAACTGLAKRYPERYRMEHRGPVGSGSDRGAEAAPIALKCDAMRPLNRYLLAELITALRDRGAKLVVLDVVLAREDGVVDQQEHAALQQVLRMPHAVPVLYAAPVELLWQEGQLPHLNKVRLAGKQDFPGAIRTPSQIIQPGISADDAPVQATIAFPAPGQPLRRYPRCFAVDGSRHAAASLPWAAVQWLKGAEKQDACVSAYRTTDEAPRIVFDVPPLTGHLDLPLGSHNGDRAHEASASRAFYHRTFGHCLATHFWRRSGGLCGEAAAADDALVSFYHGKIVVVGASNAVRRDWHSTPLGNMVGAQVVVNAMRSFTQYPDLHEHSNSELLAKKLLIVIACTPVWFVFHLFRFGTRGDDRSREDRKGEQGWAGRSKRMVGLIMGFAVTLLLVIALTLWMSYSGSEPTPSLDVLIGVLAIGAELYVEVARSIIHGVEAGIERLLPHQGANDAAT